MARPSNDQHAPVAAQLGLGAAIDQLLELGVDAGGERVAALAEHLRGALGGLDDVSVVDGLGPVRPPTMYVWSTEDPALGREAAEATASFVEGQYRFEVLEGVGHWIPEQQPGRLNALLLDHFGGSRSAG